MEKPRKPYTAAERQRRYVERRKQRGLVEVRVWAPRYLAEPLRALAADFLERMVIR